MNAPRWDFPSRFLVAHTYVDKFYLTCENCRKYRVKVKIATNRKLLSYNY